MAYTFTLWDIEFNWLAMLDKLLDGFLVGMGFVLAFLVLLCLAKLSDHLKKRKRPQASEKPVTPALARITAFIASDAMAISYQSLGQYRTALLEILREEQAATNTEGT